MNTAARAAQWLSGSPNRRIFGAAVSIAVVSIGVKVTSLWRDVAVAHQFGTSDSMDAFVIAFALPTFLINVVAGSLNAAFVSVYIESRERVGALAADRLFQGVLVLGITLLVALTLLLAAAAPWLLEQMAGTYSQEKLALARGLLFLLLPAVLFSGIATIYTGVLNAGERFALGAAAPMAIPVVSLLAVELMGTTLGIGALAGGTVLGYLLNAALVARAVSRADIGVVPRWHGWTPELCRVVRQYLPVLAGACLMSSTAIVDQAMASVLPAGSVATLSYGNKLVAVFTTLGTMALGTAVLPHFARMVVQDEWDTLRRTLGTWVKSIIAVTVPVTAVLVVASSWIVGAVFERGAFTPRDTASVGFVQAMYLLQIPFYTLGILFVRTLSAMQRNRVLLAGTAISFPLNAALNLVFMRWMGVAGIALSTSLVYVVSCFYLGLMLRAALKARAAAATASGVQTVPGLLESR